MTEQELYQTFVSAAENGDIAKVKELLDKKIDANCKGIWGFTALKAAATMGYAEIVELLIQNNADVNFTTKSGSTTLMGPCGQKKWNSGLAKVVKMLIEHNAPINAKDKDGWTALDYAMFNRHPDLVEILKKAGAHSGIIGLKK